MPQPWCVGEDNARMYFKEEVGKYGLRRASANLNVSMMQGAAILRDEPESLGSLPVRRILAAIANRMKAERHERMMNVLHKTM